MDLNRTRITFPLAITVMFHFFVLVAPAFSASEYTRRIQVGDWRGGAIDRNGDAKPDICQMYIRQDQTRYLLVIRHGGGVLLGLTDPAWGLTEDKEYRVELEIGKFKSSEVATASDDETLILQFSQARETLASLASASQMTATGKMGNFNQSLGDSELAMEALEECFRVDVSGMEPEAKPEAVAVDQENGGKKYRVVMENVSQPEADQTVVCGKGLRETLAFSYATDTQDVSEFSYEFSLETLGFGDTPVCLKVHKTGTLVSGVVSEGKVHLVVRETIDDGTTAEVTYKGVLRDDGTGTLYDIDAPYEELPVRVEPQQ